jgi:hypothetical protein
MLARYKLADIWIIKCWHHKMLHCIIFHSKHENERNVPLPPPPKKKTIYAAKMEIIISINRSAVAIIYLIIFSVCINNNEWKYAIQARSSGKSSIKLPGSNFTNFMLQ